MADDPRTEDGNQEEEGQEEYGKQDPELAEESVENGVATTASPSLRRTPSMSNGTISVRSTAGEKRQSSNFGTSNDQIIQTETSPRAGASRSIKLEDESQKDLTEQNLQSKGGQSETDIGLEPASSITKTGAVSRNGSGNAPFKDNNIKGQSRAQDSPPCGSNRLFQRRTPFEHNPPIPEERRPRISPPRCFKDYVINLREDLADFQESHGLPRTRDYSFLSLGLSLTQETGRAIYAVFLTITELFPIVAIVSLFLRFTLDKLIEILETEGTVPKVKKTAFFVAQIIIMMIPLWILVGTIIIPMFYLVLSILRRLFRLSGRRSGKAKTRPVVHASPKGRKKKLGCF